MKKPNIIAIIPARKGSKGIKNKNIKIFFGKPLIYWTIKAAKKSKYVSRIILSTDDAKIAKLGAALGAEIPFLRPKYLAQDKTTTIDTVLHILKKISDSDYILLLQPTSPLRNTNDIDSIINFTIKNNFNTAASISEVSEHPQLFYKLISNYQLKKKFKLKDTFNRHDYEYIYKLNGALFFSRTSSLIKSQAFITNETRGFIMPQSRSIDIDNSDDWKMAEYLMKNKKRK